MKVLLKEDIQKLGWFGDVVEVNNGYARNYLLPQGLATVVNDDNVRALAEEKSKRAEQRIREKKRLEEAAKTVDGAEAVIAAKANEQGHLFGSITENMIASNLRAQGFTVADEVVQMHDHIKEVGTHNVKLRFAENVVVSVKVVVVAEKQEASEVETDE
jgi:large subunit ribosomal protein L9